MMEPVVTLTDYGLTLECAVFAFWLRRARADYPRIRALFVLLFSALGFASLLGGTVHGFFPDPSTFGHELLWRLTLVAIGVVAWACWMIAAQLLFAEPVRRLVVFFTLIELWTYCGIVVFISQQFWIAIVNYLPATMLLFIAFLYMDLRFREPGPGYGMGGLILTFAAAAIQQSQLSIDPKFFNYNALYHVVQAAGLWLIFLASRSLILRR